MYVYAYCTSRYVRESVRLSKNDTTVIVSSCGFVRAIIAICPTLPTHWSMWPIANPQDAQNRREQLATKPARSLHGVRTVVADLMRCGSVYADAGLTEAVKAHGDLSKIRTFLQQPKKNYPNISRKLTLRLRELAEIEASALDVYLKYHL